MCLAFIVFPVQFKCVLIFWYFCLQHSWQQFLYTRCQNLNRKPATSPSKPPMKRLRIDEKYPSVLGDMDDVAHERNKKLLQVEASKLKLHHEIVQNLIERTFAKRRRWILDSEDLRTAVIIEEYPVLQKPLFVNFYYFSVCFMLLFGAFLILCRW